MRATLLLLWILVAGCQNADVEACTKACARPFEIVAHAGEERAKAWENMPDALRGEATLVVEDWRAELKAARERYLESCVPECQASGLPSVIRCRGRAGNLGEWKRCAK